MKKSPFRNSSSNQEGFGIERNNKRKSSKKKATKRKKPVAKKQGETAKQGFSVNPSDKDKSYNIQGTAIGQKTNKPFGVTVQNYTDDDVFAGTYRIMNPNDGLLNRAGELVTYQVNPDGSYTQITESRGLLQPRIRRICSCKRCY